MEMVSERRAGGPNGRHAGLRCAAGLPRAQAWRIVAMGSALAAFADWATGTEAWFGPVYLMLIGIAAWALGRRVAFALGLGYLALSIALNGLDIYPLGGAAALWNVMMRVSAVSAMIAAIALVRRAYGKQWLLARTDPLTGALNRQAFFEIVPATPRTTGWSLLGYADLDGFKALNDAHGHNAGDETLAAYAAHVRGGIRAGDVLARIGGDEFVVYLQVRDEAAGRKVAARLHRRMNAPGERGESGLRCSLGVLLLPPGPVSLDVEMRIADALMYRAKDAGGALVVAAAELRDGRVCLPGDDDAAPGRSRFRLVGREEAGDEVRGSRRGAGRAAV